MSLIQGVSLSKSYDQGLTFLFKEINFTIDVGKHLALVGSNGCGKTTLLKILAGIEEKEGVLLAKKGLKIGLQMQDPIFHPGVTVREVLFANFQEVTALQQAIRELEKKMAEAKKEEIQEILDVYGQLTETFETAGGYTLEQDILKIISGLGLKEEILQQFAGELSGGEKGKLQLAALLLSKPDLLLLDEPTNHLDLESLEWLEEFLQNYTGTFLCVSHDRYFLDKVIDEIWEIERGVFTQYPGNFSSYIAEKERRQKFQWLEYEKQQKELKSLTQQIHDQRIYALKAEKHASHQTEFDKSFLKRRASKVMRKAKVAEAKKEKLLTNERVEKPFVDQELKFKFPVEVETYGQILHVKDLTVGYHPYEPIFHNLNFSIDVRSRLAVIGRNGSGKTSLFKTILGELFPLQGEIIKSNRVQIGYYSQEQESLDEEKSALTNILISCKVDETTARTTLGCLKIEKGKVHLPVKNLSGGEKGKVQLCKILLSGANLLLLDEPTNHLDIHCREAIEVALQQYPGAVIFISHDRYFLTKLATEIVYLNGNESSVHLGDYETFKEKLRNEQKTISECNLITENLQVALLGKLSLLRSDQIEEKAKLEQELNNLRCLKGVVKP